MVFPADMDFWFVWISVLWISLPGEQSIGKPIRIFNTLLSLQLVKRFKRPGN